MKKGYSYLPLLPAAAGQHRREIQAGFRLPADGTGRLLSFPVCHTVGRPAGGCTLLRSGLQVGADTSLITPGLELLGGIRWQSQDIDVEVRDIDPDTPILSGNPVDKNWTDFFAGARYSTALGQKWTLKLVR